MAVVSVIGGASIRDVIEVHDGVEIKRCPMAARGHSQGDPVIAAGSPPEAMLG